MNNFLVSIIIPTYHRPDFLKRAVESSLSQTYENIEIIVVSDNELNSKAERDTVAVMQFFKSKVNVVYLKSIGNRGGCVARNRGLAEAKGEYINFLDDDDVLLPEKIHKQVQLINNTEIKLAVVGCCASIKNEIGKTFRIERPIFEEDILFSQLKHNICTTSLNLINREVCLKSGGFQFIESSQEHLFLIKVFNVMPTFEYVNEVLVEINHHEGPRISKNRKKPIGAEKLQKYVESYYKNYNTKQVKILKLAHNKNIIQAYCEIGNFRMAFKIYIRRFSIGIFNLGVIKLPLVILKNIILRYKEIK